MSYISQFIKPGHVFIFSFCLPQKERKSSKVIEVVSETSMKHKCKFLKDTSNHHSRCESEQEPQVSP